MRRVAVLALVCAAGAFLVPAAPAVEPIVEGTAPVERAVPPAAAPSAGREAPTPSAEGPGFDWTGAVAVFFTALGAFAGVLVLHDAHATRRREPQAAR